MSKSRRQSLAITVGLGLAFVGAMATAAVFDTAHEWMGVAVIVLALIHMGLSRKVTVGLWRKGSCGGVVKLFTDALLVLCLFGLGVSSVILSAHVFSWLPALPGASWARMVHFLCSFWGFVLLGVHVGAHFRIMLAHVRIPRPAKDAAKVCFVLCAACGVWSLFDLGMASYLTYSVQFMNIEQGMPLASRFMQFFCVGVLLAGVSYVVSAMCRRASEKAVSSRGKQKTIGKS